MAIPKEKSVAFYKRSSTTSHVPRK